jgi:hypothetical protein
MAHGISPRSRFQREVNSGNSNLESEGVKMSAKQVPDQNEDEQNEYS